MALALVEVWGLVPKNKSVYKLTLSKVGGAGWRGGDEWGWVLAGLEEIR